MKQLIFTLMVYWLTAMPGLADARIEQQRKDFVLAEQFISKGDEEPFSIMSSSLTDYPLYPYLQYQWLKVHLEQTLKIKAFLQDHNNTRYADLLRGKWLAYLGDRMRWQELVDHYVANGNVGLECRQHWAHYQLGRQSQALSAAKRLWLSGSSQPSECEPLFSALILSPMLTTELIWQRFIMALRSDNVLVAEAVKKYLDDNNRTLADDWLGVHRNPSLLQSERFIGGLDPQLSRIFAHGIGRMAKSDIDQALILWDARKQDVKLDGVEARDVERVLALAMARNQKLGAYQRLQKLPTADAEVREWRVRAAIYEQNWRHVVEAVETLTADERQDPRWQYWYARSLALTGAEDKAKQVFSILAKDRSFWGFQAADIIDVSYALSDRPIVLAESELEVLAATADFQAARELKILSRDQEAERQWWFAVNRLAKEKQKTAAKLAQFWHWDQLAIRTMVKADYWDDLALRFPLSYLELVQNHADRQNLDPEMIYGLMRQESMLDNFARSSAGARGLMQIMPSTGKQIARELNERWQSENSLFSPDVNIRFGSYYYKKLLSRFNGHVALATAAYNAGPARVSKWLPILRPVSADIWIETIPFKETRKYVSSVMSYMIIYQHRIRRSGLRMKDLMRDILPG